MYRRLHHSPNDTIARHIRYCEKTGEFREGETNAALQSRIRFIRDAIDGKREASKAIDSATFQKLVNDALRRFPK